jgi:hypothetical protein
MPEPVFVEVKCPSFGGKGSPGIVGSAPSKKEVGYPRLCLIIGLLMPYATLRSAASIAEIAFTLGSEFAAFP